MYQSNIVIIVGDLGSGVNFVKNLLLLGDEVYWGYGEKNKLEFLKETAYSGPMNDWLQCEFKLRNFKELYGVDIFDNDGDLSTAKIEDKSKDYKLVLPTHWPHIAIELKQKYPDISIVSLYSDDSLWQVKSYIDKKGIDNLQNFSFNGDVAREKAEYISKFGLDNYTLYNLNNMYEILNSRSHLFKEVDGYTINIACLTSNSDEWIRNLYAHLSITVRIDDAVELWDAWKKYNPAPHAVKQLGEQLNEHRNN